jgi:hypothetical protein
MKQRLSVSILLVGLCAGACALPVAAQTMKPGLWTLSNSVSSKDPQVNAAMSALQQHLANMPADQRSQVEQMMKQNGVQIDVGANGALQSKMCMTREMVERKEFPLQEGDCKQTFTQGAGNGGHIAFSCTKPHVSGAGDLTVLSDTSYRARMHIKNDDSPSQAVDMDVTANWLSANCGTLRPAK